jgi:predicted O-linked N-acetylglucosamine transferase (SPINDLY family)
MQDTITEDLQAYEQLAVTLGLNRDRLAELKARLATNRRTCALFDTDRQRRHIEEVYREMQARRLRGDAPASFGVGLAPVDPT